MRHTLPPNAAVQRLATNGPARCTCIMKWRTCGAPAPKCHGPLQLLVGRLTGLFESAGIVDPTVYESTEPRTSGQFVQAIPPFARSLRCVPRQAPQALNLLDTSETPPYRCMIRAALCS